MEINNLGKKRKRTPPNYGSDKKQKVSHSQNFKLIMKGLSKNKDVRLLLSSGHYLTVGKSTCLKGITIKELLGSGNFGTVNIGCIDGRCNFAVKIQVLNSIHNITEFKKETKISKIAGKIGTGPEVITTNVCKGMYENENVDVGIIVSKKWDSTLKSYLKTHSFQSISKRIIKKLKKKIEKLHEQKILHNDMKSDNIVVNVVNDKIVDIALIDFGFSIFFHEKGFKNTDIDFTVIKAYDEGLENPDAYY